ncbi:N,N-dimethylformamidase beta subunit family domain-containing protein [Roseimaritima ulvae]|uniref:N,N-dimethylformamidase beta subunit n=1 Tax=Roseimaritima ulvae TaxID=980254 RepID=A0A5B9R1Z2_9BACT|nr:N,N-dimethylformamidase beta subunit family domain-containing protein [Roseimaritima ulvae]QEG43835.1 N,N-dimethylformamidase beta subunit [Roseimaritima ulvae]
MLMCFPRYCFFVLALAVVLCSSLHGRAEQPQPDGPFVFGYVNEQSRVAGETLAFHLSCSGKEVAISIDRVGKTRERVFDKQNISCQAHPIPDRASSDGCNWPAAFSMPVPEQWRSGCYIATVRMTGSDQAAATSILFVVRSSTPGKNSKVLLQLATNTYNAYTNWGGHSLYAYHDRDGLQGHRVSFQRPISSQFAKWELPFIQWAETNGYAIDYAVNLDLQYHPEILQHYNLVLSVGHDEYWSSEMRDNLEQYITDGGNVAFFSGNTCCWQVRCEDNGQALTCWKQWYNTDPLFRVGDQKKLSTLWSHHLIGRPENELTGVGFLWGGYHKSHGQFMDGDAAFKVHRPDHWLFEGTDLKQNNKFGSKDTIVGYECDGCELEWTDGLPFPTHRDGTPESFTVLATCPARWAPGDCYWYDRFPKDRVGAAVLGVYTRGGTVVTSGTTDWAHGLKGQDPAVVQITKNVLDRLTERQATGSKP